MSRNILYSAGKNDECYTPAYGVRPILKYIPNNSVVWCPFDTKESNFVKLIKAAGHNVVYSHIEDYKGTDFDGHHDFYKYKPAYFDVIISNPPFTGKRHIFERALSFNKPFALMMSLTWLNDAAPKQLFMEKDLQLLMFDKRIKFNMANGEPNNKITFSTAYYCHDFLPKHIICEHLEVPK